MNGRRFAACKRAMGVAVLLLAGGEAMAGETSVELSDGATVSVSAGVVSLAVDAREVWSAPLGEGVPEGDAEVTAQAVGNGLTAIRARYTRAGEKIYEGVAVRGEGASSMKIVWAGSTLMKGDPGERTGWGVELADLTGDGVPEIIVGLRYDPVKLCGHGDHALLFRKVWDPGSSRLRPVLARRPGISPSGDIDGTPDPGDVTEPLVRAVTPAAVSRIAGDGANTYMLTPPVGLVDGDPTTAWITPPGNGAGEFVTLSVPASAYGITRLGIRTAPEGARPGSYDSPKTILAVGSNAVHRLVFPQKDPGSSTIWFIFPAPMKTRCLTLLLEESRNPSARRGLAIADLTVLTEIDQEGGLGILAGDLNDPERGEQAVSLLRTIGERAVEPIRAVWKDLDAGGKKRAVRVLAEAAPEKSVDLLALAGVDGDEVTAKIALEGLEKTGDDGAREVIVYLSSAVESRIEAAAAILSRLRTPVALEGLMTLLGEDDQARRALALRHLPNAISLDDNRPSQLWTAVMREKAKNPDGRKIVELLRVGAVFEPIADRIADLGATMYADADDFERRYRLTRVLATSKSPRALSSLLDGAGDADLEIRALAVEGLGNHHEDEAAAGAIVQALGDDEVRVRMAALLAVIKSGLEQVASEKLVSLAIDDPWPMLRTVVIHRSLVLSPSDRLAVLEAAAADPSVPVRLEGMRASALVEDPVVSRLIEGRLADPEEENEILEAAAAAAGARCQRSAVPLLYPILKRGAEPLASGDEIDAAVAAALALGAIGGDEAGRLLEKARKRSNPSTDRAIDASLKNLGRACDNALGDSDDAAH